MKNTIIVILLLLAGAVATVFALRVIGGEDAWICQEGVWVAHGQPEAPKPTTPCGPVTANTLPSVPVVPAVDSSMQPDEERIRVTTPMPAQESASPLEVRGVARGNWYFEASFPIRLRMSNGKEIAQGVATAQGDWMTEDFVPFTASLPFSVDTATGAILVLERDNPSGAPNQDAAVEIPVYLLPGESGEDMTVMVYFGSTKFDPETADCGRSYGVERKIKRTKAPARDALIALLSGPTVEEKADGYTSSINPGVAIESIIIDKGVAKVDFDAAMGEGVGGSCRVSMIRSQIENTLKQFPTVSEVVISVEGNVEEALQP